MKNKKQKRIDLLLVFLVAFLPRLILIITNASILRTPMDEMSTMATGAYFGGCDWTTLTGSAGFYYGGGFTILFAPLFRFMDDSYLIYKIILSVCAVLQSCIAPISYHLMERYFEVEDRKYRVLASIACSYFVVTRAMEMFNEHPMIFMVWIITWILCALVANQDDRKKKGIYTILLCCSLAYILTLHTRTLAVWIAVLVVIVFYYIFYKKWLVSVIPAILFGSGGYVLAKLFNKGIKTLVWQWQEGVSLRNTAVTLRLTTDDIMYPVSWNAIANIIFGQLNTITIFSGGILVFIAVLLFILYKNSIQERIVTKKVLSEQNQDGFNHRNMLLVVSVTFVICVLGTILAQSCSSWLKKVLSALLEASYGGSLYGYKAVTYVRYVGPYLGPVLLVGLVLIYYKRKEIAKYICPAVVSLGVMQLIWLAFVMPHIYKTRAACEVFVPFGLFEIKGEEELSGLVFLMGSVVMAVFFTAMMIAFKKKNIKLPLILLSVLLMYQYGYSAIYWDGAFAENYNEAADAGPELINEIEEQNQNEELFDEIYVYDTRTSIQKMHFTYQVLLKDKKIIRRLPVDTVEEAVVFSNDSANTELKEKDYLVAQVDENEYVYVKGDEYIELFEDYGIVFEENK